MHAPADALLGQADLSPDGRTLAVIDFYDRILFFDSRTFQPVGRPFDAGEWLDSVAYRPDGRTLAFGTNGGSVRVLDARTGEKLAEMCVGGSAARLAFTADGSRLVVAAGSTPTIQHAGRGHAEIGRPTDHAHGVQVESTSSRTTGPPTSR